MAHYGICVDHVLLMVQRGGEMMRSPWSRLYLAVLIMCVAPVTVMGQQLATGSVHTWCDALLHGTLFSAQFVFVSKLCRVHMNCVLS